MNKINKDINDICAMFTKDRDLSQKAEDDQSQDASFGKYPTPSRTGIKMHVESSQNAQDELIDI